MVVFCDAASAVDVLLSYWCRMVYKKSGMIGTIGEREKEDEKML